MEKPENETPKKQEKKVICEKIYTIKWTDYDDGTSTMERTNDGFDAFKLLGVLEISQLEIQQQISGVIKPDFIKRTVVK